MVKTRQGGDCQNVANVSGGLDCREWPIIGDSIYGPWFSDPTRASLSSSLILCALLLFESLVIMRIIRTPYPDRDIDLSLLLFRGDYAKTMQFHCFIKIQFLSFKLQAFKSYIWTLSFEDLDPPLPSSRLIGVAEYRMILLTEICHRSRSITKIFDEVSTNCTK